MDCKRCGEPFTKMYYLLMTNNYKHLVGECRANGITFVPLISNLSIETHLSEKRKQQESNLTLF